MRVSYNWLKDYVDIDVSPRELGDRLTLVGLEVEELHDRYQYLETVVTARVDRVEPVPGSDHLKSCRANIGDGSFTIVCGAPNLRDGMISALAKVGTLLPNGKTVTESVMRGVPSQGMLCSELELIVGPDASGIIELPADTAPGRPLKEVLGLDDWIFEIGITPNRPDCLSILGVAREVGGILGKPLKYPQTRIEEGPERIEDLVSIEIVHPRHCPRYSARVIRGVKVGPSPFWMVDRLASAGVRSISNIVDVTNFVLMETGQPTHSFDLDLVEDRRIVVKLAEEGDRFTTLDGTERILGPEMLMICDGRKQVGLAGVMGGLNTEIVDSTKDVLLEAAYFTPTGIRRTSKTLGLSTEASYRYERGLDPDLCVRAADRVIALMAEVAGGRVAAGIMDVYPLKQEKKVIPFSPAKGNAFLGTDFSPAEMVNKLEGIEIPVSGEGENLQVAAPSFRVDLYREVDLFEEVARLAGFDRVPATLPPARAPMVPHSPSWQQRVVARELLEGRGLSEAVNYSFIPENFPDMLKLAENDRRRQAVRIINPLSEDQVLMRTSLVPGLLETLRRNQSRQVWDVALYEIGMLYFPREGEELPEERLAVGGVLAGGRSEISWHGQTDLVDFYDVKGVVEDLLAALKVEAPSFDREGLPPFLDPAASARVTAGDRELGWLGRADLAVAKAYGIKKAGTDAGGEAWIFELDMSSILEVQGGVPQYTALPRHPHVERDLAMLLDRAVQAGDALAFIVDLGEPLLTEVFLFDVYEGRQVGEDRRSLAFRMRYRSPERTLTDEEVNAVHERVTGAVLKAFNATLR